VQLSELLGLDVLDATAQRLGTIVDVRLAVTGDLDDDPDTPTLFGLVISPRTRSSYLGYERSDLRRPTVLAALLYWRHRGTFVALWDDVARVDAESVSLRTGFGRYAPTLRDHD
jgi:sporulation protein YlmC with PRC-barrel domain